MADQEKNDRGIEELFVFQHNLSENILYDINTISDKLGGPNSQFWNNQTTEANETLSAEESAVPPIPTTSTEQWPSVQENETSSKDINHMQSEIDFSNSNGGEIMLFDVDRRRQSKDSYTTDEDNLVNGVTLKKNKSMKHRFFTKISKKKKKADKLDEPIPVLDKDLSVSLISVRSKKASEGLESDTGDNKLVAKFERNSLLTTSTGNMSGSPEEDYGDGSKIMGTNSLDQRHYIQRGSFSRKVINDKDCKVM